LLTHTDGVFYLSLYLYYVFLTLTFNICVGLFFKIAVCQFFHKRILYKVFTTACTGFTDFIQTA